MGNLLHASLSRMAKSRAFLLAVLAELAYTALVAAVCWDHYADGFMVVSDFGEGASGNVCDETFS